MIAGMVISNLFYLVGAIVAATLVSGIVLLRHRRPRSLESSIDMFTRELKALRPERPGSPLTPPNGARPIGGVVADTLAPGGRDVLRPRQPEPQLSPDEPTGRPGRPGGVPGRVVPGGPGVPGGSGARGRPNAGGARSVTRLVPKPAPAADLGRGAPGSEGARASSPEQEGEPG